MLPDGDPVLRYLDHFKGPGEAVLASACDLSMEGIASKRADVRHTSQGFGLASFARVTGGKGLHLVVPLAAAKGAAPLGWAEAKQFTRLVCVMMEPDAPMKYTTTMAKQARGGKILLDYLRNDRFATAIATWSPRGRPGAPVAWPVPWSAVKPGLDPAGWRLTALLDARPPRDPWAGFEAAAGDLRAAITKATKT